MLGTYIGAPNAETGEAFADAARSTEVARLRAEVDSEDAELSCLPVVDGTVCDLSVKAGTLIIANTESQPPERVDPR
ncbi:MAG: hypothetical protein ABIR32_00140 [Ilumatobacteraceae bacterium]